MIAPVLVMPALAMSLPRSPPTVFEMPKSRILRRVLPSSRSWRKRILRLEIAMHDPDGVRLVERARGLGQIVEREVGGEAPAFLELPLEVGAIQELHDQERGPVELGGHVGVDDFDDVSSLLMRGRSARLALEALDRLAGPRRR